MGCHSLPQGIFLTQGLDPGLLHGRQVLYQLSLQTTSFLACLENRKEMYSLKVRVKVKSLSRVRLFATPWTVAYRLLHPWDFPGKGTGVGCHCLLQRIFSTQGSNPLYHLSHQGSLSNVYIPSIQLGQGRTRIKGRISVSLKHVGEFSAPMRTG